jgi:Ion channel
LSLNISATIRELLSWSELVLGLLICTGVFWDGFATTVLPRTVAPMRRLSGKFTRYSWWLWSRVSRKMTQPELRLNFLAVYGPLSVMILLVLWGGLIVLGFALIYQGLGDRLQVTDGRGGFGTLLYMSGSTFLTLGLGDVTCTDPIGRTFILLEAASGYVFLAIIITYMPLLDQAYGSREIGNMLIHSRAGRPPGAIQFLRNYSGSDREEVLRGNLREAERWMAEILESHLSHPVLSFYRAQHEGQAWLLSVMTVLDSSALLIAGGQGLPAAQARLTYRMGLRLLVDLMRALGIQPDPKYRERLTEADLPDLIAVLDVSSLPLTLSPAATSELLRLARRYDLYLVTLSHWLVIPLPPWFFRAGQVKEPSGVDDTGAWDLQFPEQ